MLRIELLSGVLLPDWLGRSMRQLHRTVAHNKVH